MDLDNTFIVPLMKFMDTPIKIDLKRAEADLVESEKILRDYERKIWELANQRFVIHAPAQLANVLLGMGLDTEKRTKVTLQMSTDIDDLIPLKGKHDIIAVVIDYKELLKKRSSYIEPFINYYDPKIEGFRVSYQAFNVPTGRLSSGLKDKDKKSVNTFFAGFNIQSIIKTEPKFYTSEKSNEPDAVLGYKFIQDDKGKHESWGTHLAPRCYIKPYPGHYVVDFDFSGEELVIIANLSRDPAYYEPLSKGGDPHKATAYQMWGKEAYNKERRTVAKECNFGLNYGGYAGTLKGRMPEKSMGECQDYYDRWRITHKVLLAYQKRRQQESRKLGYFKTRMGRIRRVSPYYSSPNRKVVSFADRTVSNGEIQGLAGDILRYVMIKIYNCVFCEPSWEAKIRFIATLHDEIAFSVDKRPEYLFPIIARITRCFEELDFLNFDIPLRASNPLLGNTFGSLFEFENKDGIWQPV
ncbi:MAG TPA: hypothetical protein ENH82_20195 [bacterium]|nr:hypothetical protein [bacterium]